MSQVLDEVIIEFSATTNKVETGGDKLIEILTEIRDTLKDTNIDFKELNKGLSETANKMNDVGNKGGKGTLKWATTFTALTGAATIAYKKVKDWTAESAAFIGTQTRFNAVFDKTSGELQEAQKWVDEYSASLALDSKEVMNSVATIRMLTSNMGIQNEESIKMSKNLTQVAYDLAAVRGEYDDVSMAMTAITSGLGGEAEAMKKYGVYLNQATLQATLYEAGINRTVSSLNAAERAQLIYYQIMKTTAGQQGYYAKTLLSPANALNIIRTQFTLLAREIGNVFIPILTALVPIVMVLTKALRNLARALANLFGIDVDFDAYSDGIGNIAGGIDGIGDSADGASKKMKNMLRDFDELHVVNFDDATGSGSGMGAGGGGLNLPEIEYKGFESALDKLEEKLKKIKDYIIAIGIALGSFVIAKGVLDFLDKLDLLSTKSNTLVAALGIGLSLGSIYLLYQGVKKLLKGQITPESIGETALGMIGLTSGSMITAKGLGVTLGLGDAIKITAGITLLIVGMTIWWEGIKEKDIPQIILGSLISGAGGGLIALALGASAGVALTIGIGAAIVLSILGFSISNWDEISKNLDDIKTKITETFTNFEFDSSGIKTFFDDLSSNFTNLNDTAITPVKEAFLNFGTESGQAISDLYNTCKPVIDAFAKLFGGLLLFTVLGALYGIEAGLGALSGVVVTVINFISGVIKVGLDFLTGIIDSIRKILNGFITFLDGVFSLDMEKIVEGLKGMWDGFKSFVSTIFKTVVNVIVTALNAIIDVMNIGIRAINAIRIPDWEIFGSYAGKSMNLTLINNIPYYQNGGFPTKGDLFIANEREPELIGSMGNRSVVANNTQITEGIADASYYGMRKALKEVDMGGDVAVYIGNRQITDYVVKQKKMDDKRYGR